MKRLFKIISFPLGAICGIGFVLFLMDFLKERFGIELSAVITDLGVGVLFGACMLIPGFIFFALSDKFAIFLSKAIARMERRISKMPTKDLVLCLIGLMLGLVIAFLITQALQIGSPLISTIINLLLYLSFAILGVRVALARRDEVVIDLSGGSNSNSYIPDSSVLIDGRIAEVISTGFITGNLIISQAVVNEMKKLTESEDVLKRARGRRGMDMLAALQEIQGITLQFDSVEGDGDTDSRLLALAKAKNAAIITNDYNLNKLAHAGGVRLLNLNDLSNAVKPVLLPGEELSLQIVREGKEFGQGVAYFDDGTMIVVEGGKRYVGQNKDCVVTSVLQTSAGRMIFAKITEVEGR